MAEGMEGDGKERREEHAPDPSRLTRGMRGAGASAAARGIAQDETISRSSGGL